MAQNNLPPLSEAQMEIMTIIWDAGSCTVADVVRALQELRSVSRNTVHTMMTRLVDKGWLLVNSEAGRFTYSATTDRDSVQRDCLERMVQTVFDGSAEGLLLSLLQNRSLAKDEATRIRQMIRDAEKRS